MQDLILRPEIQTPVIVLHSEVVEKAKVLANDASAAKVEDVFGLTTADDIQKRCKDLLKEIEAERVRVKAPFLAICTQIDEACRSITGGLTDGTKALAGRIVIFTREQERLRQLEEIRIRAEQSRLEAIQRAEQEKINKENQQRAEEAAKANRPAPPPVMAPIPKPVAPVFVPPPLKSTSTTTMKKKFLVIDDKMKIPWNLAGLTLLEPVEKNIEKLLRAGCEVPGCRLEEREVPRGL